MNKLRELLAKKEELKKEVRGFLDDNKIKEAEEKMEEVRALEAQIKIEEELLEEERKQAGEEFEKRQEREQEKRTEIPKDELEERAVKKYLLGEKLTEAEERAVVNSEDNSALLPTGFIKYLEDIKMGYKPLKDLVHVIPVTTLEGKMPVNYGVGKRGLANLGLDDEIEEDLLNTEEVNYAVKDLGKIIPVRNSTLEDSAISIKEMIGNEFVEDAVYTENEDIVTAFRGVAKKVTVKDDKELVKQINLMSPTAKARGAILVNPLGFDYLDNLRDKEGRPLLRELSQGGEFVFKGMRVREVDEDILTGTKPIILAGDFHKAVKMFDRKGVEIAADSSAGFTRNRTLFRVIKRHDVQQGKLGKKPEKFAVEITVDEGTTEA